MRILPGIIYGIVLVCCPFTIFGAQKSSAQYTSEYSAIFEKGVSAREQIAQEQAAIESLKHQIGEVDSLILKVIKEQYSILGITALDVDNASILISQCLADLKQLQKKFPQELIQKKNEIQCMVDRISEFRTAPACKLSRFSNQLIQIDQILSSVITTLQNEERARAGFNKISDDTITKTVLEQAGTVETLHATPQLVNTYVVKDLPGDKRETLSRIAGYSQIYGDPRKWYRIYISNKDEIDQNFEHYIPGNKQKKMVQPYDYLTPGQVLKIPR